MDVYSVVLVVAILSRYSATANEFYVFVDNPFSCPENSTCETIDRYLANQATYFVSDTIFYFYEGIHVVQSEQTIIIANVSNITFQGLGEQKDGFHETVKQSTTILQCKYPNSNFVFLSSHNVAVRSLTITNCGKAPPNVTNLPWYLVNPEYQRKRVSELYSSNITLGAIEVTELSIFQVSIQNSSGYGLVTINAYDLTISESSFAQNGNHLQCTDFYDCKRLSGGNVVIFYINSKETCSTDRFVTHANILNANISSAHGSNHFLDSNGLMIELDQSKTYDVDLALVNIVAFDNSKGNMAFEAHKNTRYQLLINNMLSSNGGSTGGLNINDGFYLETKECNCGVPQLTKNIIVNNSLFHSNTGYSFSGGLNINIEFSSSESDVKWNTSIQNTCFFNNSGFNTLHLSIYNVKMIYLCNVKAHYGSKIIGRYNEYYTPSAILLYQVNAVIDGLGVEHNDEVGILAVDSNMIFHGENNILQNNTGNQGGGMYLIGTSYFFLKLPATVHFIANHAEENGGAIFVQNPLKSLSYVECFFQIDAGNGIFDLNITNTNSGVFFKNNTAGNAGSLLYGGIINRCVQFDTNFNLWKSDNIFDAFFHYEDSREGNVSLIASDANRVCFCYMTSKPNCSKEHESLAVFPGQTVNISIITVGQRDGASAGIVDVVEMVGENIINTSQMPWRPVCENLTYTFGINKSIENGSYKNTVIYISAHVTNYVFRYSSTQGSILYKISILDCPPGFTLSDAGKCACNKEITNSFIGTVCYIGNQSISRQGNLWMGYDLSKGCIIAHEGCPFDYCNSDRVNFYITKPDPQCALNRSGVLCGKCAKGLSLLLGSNECDICSNDNMSLIIPFGLAGIALVALLIVLNMTVSTGIINGLIFFANIVKLNEVIFFPNGSVPFISQFVSWLNLDLGIKTCFYNGMDSYAKVWLQFAFPFYIWLIIATMIILAQYTKFYKVIGSNAVPVLSTLILLAYVKLFRTVTFALLSVKTYCSDEYTKLLWRIDPNVEYFSPEHAILLIFSLAILILLILPFTFVLLFLPVIERYINKLNCCHFWIKLKPFFDAYGGPYKDQCRFWTGLVLLARLVVSAVATSDSSEEVTLATITSCVAFLLTLSIIFGGVYKQWYTNFAESIFFSLLIIMCFFAVDKRQSFGTAFAVFIAFAILIAIMCFHIAVRLREQKYFKQIEENISSKFKEQDNTQVPTEQVQNADSIKMERSPSLLEIRKRESLLYDDSIGFYQLVNDEN